MSEEPTDAVEQLVADAEQVVAVAVRLGRLKDHAILSDLNRVKFRPAGTAPDPESVVALQTSLNVAVNDIAPISVRDLRSGWSPFITKKTGGSVICMGLFAIVLMCVTAYMTLLYNRVSLVHTNLVELQSARAPEQTTRLYNLFKKNEGDMRDALRRGDRDLVTEVFYKNLFDLQSTYERLEASVSLAPQVTDEAAIFQRLQERLESIVRWVSGASDRADPAAAAVQEEIEKLSRNYGRIGVGPALAGPGPAAGSLPTDPPDKNAVEAFFSSLTQFVNMIGLPRADPRAGVPLYDAIFRLREALNSIGLWYLPALYGMLGSVVFYMRRFLDPNVPNPPWINTAYRIFLGAFAGIIVVWFWAPTPHKGGEMTFSNLSSFAVAFLVGFSIEIFFQAMDRLVTNIGQAVSKS